MSDSSPLLKLFAAQGYKIAIRKERMRGPLSAGSHGENDSPVNDDETSLPQPASLEAGDDDEEDDEEEEVSVIQTPDTPAPLPSTSLNPSSKRMRL
jgi:hypothetical protein